VAKATDTRRSQRVERDLGRRAPRGWVSSGGGGKHKMRQVKDDRFQEPAEASRSRPLVQQSAKVYTESSTPGEPRQWDKRKERVSVYRKTNELISLSLTNKRCRGAGSHRVESRRRRLGPGRRDTEEIISHQSWIDVPRVERTNSNVKNRPRRK